MSMYVCSDLHGMYDIYEQILDYIKPEDKVICLGDCGDRGYKNWELIKAVYTNPQFIYLMGNHEDMLINAMEECLAGYPFNESLELVIVNGGYDTYRGWLKETPEERKVWLNRLRTLPIYMDYFSEKNNTIWHLSHAGYTPYRKDLPIREDLIWDRNHFRDKVIVPEDNGERPNEICVHGHTPIPFVADELHMDVPHEPTLLIYGDGHKIDIDNGSFWSGGAILLNLDTCEHIPFYDRVKGNIYGI